MSLHSSNLPVTYDFNRSSVGFVMIDDGDQEVLCSITDQALRQFDRRTKLDGPGLLGIFSAHRAAIENIAIEKYRRGEFDQGNKIVIRQQDVPPQ
jgi:hypothetical protein